MRKIMMILSSLCLLSCQNLPFILNDAPVAMRNTNLGPCANEIAEVKFNGYSRATFQTEIRAPGSFKHQFKVITLDASSLSQGGTLNITGKMGNRQASGSFILESANPNYPCDGLELSGLKSANNRNPGVTFNLTHKFTTPQVFRLLIEGSWEVPEGAVNDVDFTFEVR